MQTSASSARRRERASAETPDEGLAIARWENEGGATSEPMRHATFFSIMFNWFRTPERARISHESGDQRQRLAK